MLSQYTSSNKTVRKQSCDNQHTQFQKKIMKKSEFKQRRKCFARHLIACSRQEKDGVVKSRKEEI